MSYRDHKGAWVIPPEQVKEFLSSEIDYNKLINDCLIPKIKIIPSKRNKKSKESIWNKPIKLKRK